MDRIVRRVAAAQVAATPEGLHAQAQALSARGDSAAAAALLQQAVGLGHLPSRAHLADLFLFSRGGFAEDWDTAFALAEEGARLGCHHCQGVLARCYEYGAGCSEDEARSLALARASAAEGSKYGQSCLGSFYYLGKGGVAQDYAAALAQTWPAAAQGYDVAQNFLGCLYAVGQGVAQDYAEALRWFKLAAAQGDCYSMYQVGAMYENGVIAAADGDCIHWQMFCWYNAAAKAGCSEAVDALKRLKGAQ